MLHRDQFPALEAASPELVQRLVAIMNDRSRDQVRAQERDDKLRALGKLSAGLAHELNNPAAAIARAGQALAQRAAAKPALFVELVGYWDVRQAAWYSSVNTGMQLDVSDNVQLDFGTHLPITHSVDREYFLGISFRR